MDYQWYEGLKSAELLITAQLTMNCARYDVLLMCYELSVHKYNSAIPDMKC